MLIKRTNHLANMAQLCKPFLIHRFLTIFNLQAYQRLLFADQHLGTNQFCTSLSNQLLSISTFRFQRKIFHFLLTGKIIIRSGIRLTNYLYSSKQFELKVNARFPLATGDIVTITCRKAITSGKIRKRTNFVKNTINCGNV